MTFVDVGLSKMFSLERCPLSGVPLYSTLLQHFCLFGSSEPSKEIVIYIYIYIYIYMYIMPNVLKVML